ncbi:bacillithiol biosynthesis deacetylase BshB1 [Bacillus suaedaesalsae]|uniref:Bacillithiol biosynthesis deacetylase BshB1 n=1 Tax=Bacillus suaedaesalsae TaxID=2810349 RepID=A0ABS2DMV4_9BACI|nr:bacillithiol biosynthesis deacetylase BshB1 [Bacillus suaedaesalsae]MBM6619837.1 bacillithiol biosynthesis deacetylase BshB1 [Bacillus suaedaesalsae]
MTESQKINNHQLDILAFGAHADDVEIGMAGTIAKYTKNGWRIGICDLTKAELSSNGTTLLRYEEAKNAASILGVSIRENLQFPDRGLFLQQEYIRKVSYVIRKYKPTYIFTPYEIDRHPDHGNCTSIVEQAVFSAGIKNYQVDEQLPAHKVSNVFYYFINGFHKSTFMIDISETIIEKIHSLEAYKSQFTKTTYSVDTPLVNGYVELVKNRERLFGSEVGVEFAEGFISKKPILLGEGLLGEKR